jgi:hypothetical protein
MLSNPERAKRNIHEAETVDLLDRITAFRQGMEPDAVVLIEEELIERGVTAEDVQAHWEHVRQEVIYLSDGVAARCSRCHRAAVERRWGWHLYDGWLPIFPRVFYYCAGHRPDSEGSSR